MATLLQIAGPADFHVHLRQGSLSELVTPHVRQGGFTLAYVMVECWGSLRLMDRLMSLISRI